MTASASHCSLPNPASEASTTNDAVTSAGPPPSVVAVTSNAKTSAVSTERLFEPTWSAFWREMSNVPVDNPIHGVSRRSRPQICSSIPVSVCSSRTDVVPAVVPTPTPDGSNSRTEPSSAPPAWTSRKSPAETVTSPMSVSFSTRVAARISAPTGLSSTTANAPAS